jgi:HEAT repeat protein
MDNTQWAEWLQALELAQVTISATIDPTGRLGSVGGLWPKLLAASKDAATLGLLRIVVVSDEQPDVAPELLTPDASPLRVLQAATLQEAVQKLYEEHGPREAVRRHEREQGASLDILGKSVPVATHYQVLPLLQEVKRERLPQAGQERYGEREHQEGHSGFRGVDILRWEEEVREERVTYERVPLEQVFSDFRSVAKAANTPVPRFVVLGPPGSGKTTLTQYLGWQAAQRVLHLSGRFLLPVRIRLREWEAWATREEVLEQSMPQYLAERYKALSPAPHAAQWQRWLQKGEVLLLLDGLDEIEGKPFFLAALKTTLMTFPECPTVLTCRTVSFEQHRTLCPDFPIFILAGLDPDQRDTYIRAFPAEHRDCYDPDTLINQLTHTPQLLPLAANPLLLNIICYVVDDVKGVIPATRGELYKKALEKLLTRRPQRVEVRYPGEEPNTDEKLAILERTALNLFAKWERRLIFTEKELGQELKQALSEEGYGEAPAPWANALRADLTHNSGILRGSPTQGSFFLHLTIQEFLAAAAIARIANDKGWETPVEIAGTEVSTRHLVDSKAWDPRWQEVIMLLAGQLGDPAPLLMLLADSKKDDLFNCRLALAALCLPEVRSAISGNQSAIVDRLTTAALSRWLQHERNSTDAAVPHLTRALPALGQVNGRMEGTPLLQWLCQRLRDPAGDVRSGVAEALGRIGEAVAQYPEVLSALVQAVLHDTDELVRAQATESFRRMGAAAAQHSEVLSALVQAALYDEDWFVRSGAARALERMGAAATQHPEVLSALEAALHDENPHVRSHAADALRQMGVATVQHPAMPPALVQGASHDKDACVPSEAADTLKQVGAAAAQHPEVLLALVQALHDEEGGVRRGAARALGQMGGAATRHPEVLPALVQALYDEDGGVRSETAEALGRMREAITQHPNVLSTLVQVALHDTDGGVRSEVAEALGWMGAAATQHPRVLLALVRIALHDTDGGVRSRAAEALGQIGEAAARHPEVLPALVQAMHDEDGDVRSRAAEALGQMMAQGVRVFRRRWGKVEGKRVEELATLRE